MLTVKTRYDSTSTGINVLNLTDLHLLSKSYELKARCSAFGGTIIYFWNLIILFLPLHSG
jgi:hypothetical protein